MGAKLGKIILKILKKYNLWKKSFKERKRYCTSDNHSFYRIATKYLPSNQDDIILDIGTGDGDFVGYFNLQKYYGNVYLLDGNPETVKKLKERFLNVKLIKVPNKLPFEDSTISFIHCSHLIEHLYMEELYKFLIEIDRVLKPDGILIISTPLYWHLFYNDITHIKPYNPPVLQKYLCGMDANNLSRKRISREYETLELIYQYSIMELDEGWGSNFIVLDLIMQSTKKILKFLGIKRFERKAYTIALKKQVQI